MYNRAETSLAFDNDVRDAHLAAKSGDEDNKLDRVNIVCDDNERCFLGFDKGNAMV